MNEITVTVSGVTGSGKTTIMNLIDHALRSELGLQTVVENSEYQDDPMECIAARAQALRDKDTVVTITEQHLSRMPVKKGADVEEILNAIRERRNINRTEPTFGAVNMVTRGPIVPVDQISLKITVPADTLYTRMGPTSYDQRTINYDRAMAVVGQ